MTLALAYATVLVMAVGQGEGAARDGRGEIAGLTMDAAGRPLAGVEIDATLDWQRLATNQFWRQAAPPAERPVRVRSDAQGRFAIGVERGPDYLLRFGKDGYRTGRVTASAGLSFSVRLEPGRDEPPAAQPPSPGGVAGCVRDAATGQPIVNAAVRLPWEHAALSVSGADGCYAVPWTEKAAQDLKLVVAPGYRIGCLPKAAFGRPEPARADLALEAGSVVHGRVVDAEGRGMAGLAVVVDTDLRVAADHTYSGIAWVVTTNAEGEYRIAELAPGDRFWVRTLLFDGTPAELGEGRASKAPIDLGTVRAGPTTSVEGVVRGRDGVRIEAGRVHALRVLDRPATQWLVAHDTPSWPIDATGAYRIPRLPPGRHELCFSVAGAEHEVRVVVAGPTGGRHEIDVEMGKGRVFRGRVADAEGKPIDAALLRAMPWGDSELRPLVPPDHPEHLGRFLVGNVRVLTRPDGTFRLERVRSHVPIRLTVEKAGYRTASLRVEPGDEPPAEIRLTAR